MEVGNRCKVVLWRLNADPKDWQAEAQPPHHARHSTTEQGVTKTSDALWVSSSFKIEVGVFQHSPSNSPHVFMPVKY